MNRVMQEKLSILARTSIEIADKFIHKVESGRAKSVETYADMKRLKGVAETFLKDMEPKPVEVVKKVTETERKVLECLAENSRADGEMCITFSWIVDDTKLTLAQVRRSCRALRKKGLAEFYRGLMTEDGEAAGSGYSITRAGESVISPCDVCGEPSVYEYDGKKECEEHYKQSPKAEQAPLL